MDALIRPTVDGGMVDDSVDRPPAIEYPTHVAAGIAFPVRRAGRTAPVLRLDNRPHQIEPLYQVVDPGAGDVVTRERKGLTSGDVRPYLAERATRSPKPRA